MNNYPKEVWDYINKEDIPLSNLISHLVSKCLSRSIPFDWVYAMIKQESLFNQYAYRPEPGYLRLYGHNLEREVNRIGNGFTRYIWDKEPLAFASSYGYMQLMWGTAVQHGFDNPFPGALYDPLTNLEFGIQHLGYHLKKSDGDLAVATDAYNDGTHNQRDSEGNLTDTDYVSLVAIRYESIFNVDPVERFNLTGI